MATVNYDLVFDGEDDYIEIPDHADFSVATTGQLCVSAWIRPDVLTFPVSQSTGYVHWMGKGEAGQHEWMFRMYNAGHHGHSTATQSYQLLCVQPQWRTRNRKPLPGTRAGG